MNTQQYRIVSVVVVALAAMGCATTAPPEAGSPGALSSLPALADGRVWKLAWHDEFDGESLDPAKWEIIGDIPRRDGFWVKDDAYLDGDGQLVLRTKRDGDRFTCGAIRTQAKFEHRYGYWEVRCRMPEAEGHWPAFWLYSRPGVGTIGNEGRDGTEIDIVEMPWRDGKVQHALHWDGYGEHHKSRGRQSKDLRLTRGFHTYAIHWTPDEYVFYIDGEEVWRTSAGGVSQVPAFIKLTEEIGDWGGDIKKAALPDHFLVDYVRVYDEVER